MPLYLYGNWAKIAPLLPYRHQWVGNSEAIAAPPDWWKRPGTQLCATEADLWGLWILSEYLSSSWKNSGDGVTYEEHATRERQNRLAHGTILQHVLRQHWSRGSRDKTTLNWSPLPDLPTKPEQTTEWFTTMTVVSTQSQQVCNK